ncbi:MAG: chloride channel protein [Steroidobacteraceae bacterium]
MTSAGNDPEKAAPRSDLIVLGLLAPVAGIAAGALGAAFRLVLDHANGLRDLLVARTGGWGIGGPLLLAAAAAVAAALAAWLVRRVSPEAAGSGIPRVMAVLDGDEPPAPIRVVPVKFVAGTLAIGSGLS